MNVNATSLCGDKNFVTVSEWTVHAATIIQHMESTILSPAPDEKQQNPAQLSLTRQQCWSALKTEIQLNLPRSWKSEVNNRKVKTYSKSEEQGFNTSTHKLALLPLRQILKVKKIGKYSIFVPYHEIRKRLRNYLAIHTSAKGDDEKNFMLSKEAAAMLLQIQIQAVLRIELYSIFSQHAGDGEKVLKNIFLQQYFATTRLSCHGGNKKNRTKNVHRITKAVEQQLNTWIEYVNEVIQLLQIAAFILPPDYLFTLFLKETLRPTNDNHSSSTDLQSNCHKNLDSYITSQRDQQGQTVRRNLHSSTCKQIKNRYKPPKQSVDFILFERYPKIESPNTDHDFLKQDVEKTTEQNGLKSRRLRGTNDMESAELADSRKAIVDYIFDYFEVSMNDDGTDQNATSAFSPLSPLRLDRSCKKRKQVITSRFDQTCVERDSRSTSTSSKSVVYEDENSLLDTLPRSVMLTAPVDGSRSCHSAKGFNSILSASSAGGRNTFVGSHFNATLMNTTSLFRQVTTHVNKRKVDKNLKRNRCVQVGNTVTINNGTSTIPNAIAARVQLSELNAQPSNFTITSSTSTRKSLFAIGVTGESTVDGNAVEQIRSLSSGKAHVARSRQASTAKVGAMTAITVGDEGTNSDPSLLSPSSHYEMEILDSPHIQSEALLVQARQAIALRSNRTGRRNLTDNKFL